MSLDIPLDSYTNIVLIFFKSGEHLGDFPFSGIGHNVCNSCMDLVVIEYLRCDHAVGLGGGTAHLECRKQALSQGTHAISNPGTTHSTVFPNPPHSLSYCYITIASVSYHINFFILILCLLLSPIATM